MYDLNFLRRYFGSGVITATALIHLLEPAADDELGPANTRSLGGCISDAWGDYPYGKRHEACVGSFFAHQAFAFSVRYLPD